MEYSDIQATSCRTPRSVSSGAARRRAWTTHLTGRSVGLPEALVHGHEQLDVLLHEAISLPVVFLADINALVGRLQCTTGVQKRSGHTCSTTIFAHHDEATLGCHLRPSVQHMHQLVHVKAGLLPLSGQHVGRTAAETASHGELGSTSRQNEGDTYFATAHSMAQFAAKEPARWGCSAC